MAIDFGGVLSTDNYTTAISVLDKINGADQALAMMLDPTYATLTGTPVTGAKRITSGGVIQNYAGGWSNMPTGYLEKAGGTMTGLLTLSTVQQSIIANTATGSYATWQYNGTSNGDVGTGNQIVSGGATTDFGITSRAGKLLFGVGSATKAQIDTTGNFGIGVVPTQFLHVKKDQNAASVIQLENATAGTASAVVFTAASDVASGYFGTYSSTHSSRANQVWVGSSTNHSVIFNVNSTEVMRMNTSASLGVGTGAAAIASVLHIKSATGIFTMETTAARNSNNDYISFRDATGCNGTGVFKINQSLATDLVLATNNTTRLTIGTGDTMTQAGVRPIIYDASLGAIRIKGNASGWAQGVFFTGSSDTDRGGFGAYGSSDTLNYWYVGIYAAEKFIFQSTGELDMMTNNVALRQKDSGGTMRDVLYTDATSAVHLRGYRNSAMLVGANGATYLYDSAGSGAIRVRIDSTGTRIGDSTAASTSLDVAGSARTEPESVAFSATPTFNAATSNLIVFGNLTANVTSITMSNPVEGQFISIRFRQDATGGRTVALPSGAKVSGSVAATANLTSYLNLTYNATDSRWEGNWTNIPA